MDDINIDSSVICIKTNPFPRQSNGASELRKGGNYIIQGLKKNPCCGAVVVDVGINKENSKSICICGVSNKNTSGIRWFSIKRFVKKEIKVTAEVSVISIVEDIPVNSN